MAMAEESDSPAVIAVITANPTEEKSVRHFLQLGRDAGEVWEGARECTWKNDPFLIKSKVKVDYIGVLPKSDYEAFTISTEDGSQKVIGVHTKCLQQAANTDGGALDTTTKLLQYAKDNNLRLTVIFSVGCCGYSTDGKSEKDVRNIMGRVLLANVFEDYLARGKQTEEGELQLNPGLYTGDRGWVSHLQDHRITKPGIQPGTDGVKFKDIPVAEVPRFATGPLVVKSESFGDKIRGVAYKAGIEMEAAGFAKALDLFHKQGNENIPKFVLVKGVSDFGNKSEKGATTFFGEEIAEVSDGIRQQVATLHSIALVTRGVIERFVCPPPVVDLKLFDSK